jgi:hypothetical protein
MEKPKQRKFRRKSKTMADKAANQEEGTDLENKDKNEVMSSEEDQVDDSADDEKAYCLKCNEECKTKSVECKLCNDWCHAKCASMNKFDYDYLSEA